MTTDIQPDKSINIPAMRPGEIFKFSEIVNIARCQSSKEVSAKLDGVVTKLFQKAIVYGSAESEMIYNRYAGKIEVIVTVPGDGSSYYRETHE